MRAVLCLMGVLVAGCATMQPQQECQVSNPVQGAKCEAVCGPGYDPVCTADPQKGGAWCRCIPESAE